MAIHASAARGYQVASDIYVQGRPTYPPEALAWLQDDLALNPSKKVLEVGAGTGKFIPTLRQSGAKMLALEPVAAMRAKLVAANPDVQALEGTAEAIPLPNASVDAVVCAQAFHWFATKAALAEFCRVLVPGGRLGLIWNVRDESVDWVAALTAITDKFENHTPRFKSGAWQLVFPFDGLEPLSERHASNTHVGSAEDVIIGRTFSTSFIAALPEAQKQEVEAQVRDLIARTPALAGQAHVVFPYKTLMLAYQKI